MLAETEDRLNLLLSVDGDRTPDSFHRELGELMWEFCGMARSDAGLRKALERIPQIREEFWRRIKVPGTGEEFNQSLEKANRIVDYLELAELMCLDALHRSGSCGGHFREESQTPDGEAARKDDEFAYAAAWEFTGTGEAPTLHKEDLVFESNPPPSGATHEAHPARLAAEERRRRRCHVHVRGGRHLARHVLPGDARHPQRGADPRGRGAGRLRPRLPRGHLRRLLAGHQRRRPRPRAHHHLPAAHAVLQGRRHHRRRAVAGRRLPGREGSGRRPAFDRIIQAGGYITAPTGAAPEAHATPVPKPDADFAFEHAECIGCGACVAACPNGAAMLFTSAKVNHLNVLPQGAPERETGVLDMVAQMDDEGFGGCTLTGECATACPKGIPLVSITSMNKEWLRATRKARPK